MHLADTFIQSDVFRLYIFYQYGTTNNCSNHGIVEERGQRKAQLNTKDAWPIKKKKYIRQTECSLANGVSW